MWMLVLMAALAGPPAAAPKLATLDWVVTRADPSLGAFYADVLARALREQGLQVVTPQELAVLIGQERQKALLGCNVDTACLAELTNAVGCDATLVVHLTRLDSTLTASIKVLSARDGHPLVETRAEADSEKVFAARLDDAAAAVADQLVAGHAEARQRARARLPLVTGGVVLAAGVGALAFSLHQRDVVNEELARAHAVTEAAAAAAGVGKVAQTAGWVAAGVGAAVLGVGAAMLLSAGAPEGAVHATAVVGPGGAFVGVGGTWP